MLNTAQQDAINTIADWARANGAAQHDQQATISAQLPDGDNLIHWGERNFYIPPGASLDDAAASANNLLIVKQRVKPIRLLPHQRVILKLFFDEAPARYFNCAPNFQTLIYSTVKKSGKTAIAAMVARWIAETWGSHSEVYALANDLEQARGRIYQAAINSIELDPRYKRADKGITGYWRVIEREASCLASSSTLKAVSADYKGEAGSNPTATLWSELWGYTSEASQRLWDELTPVPTRARSIRYVETYAGYENESSILNDIEDRVKSGYRLTHSDLAQLGLQWPWPFEEDLPFYVHERTRTFAYWDSGERARRMPWQTPAYYQSQSDLRPNAFRRLHLNERVSAADDGIPIEWWDRLIVPPPGVPPLDKNTPVVVAADASVSGDCTAIIAVSRDPASKQDPLVRLCKVWTPEQGRPLDYSATIEPALRDWCREYNVVEIAYDVYQLHDLMTRLRNDGVAWCRAFSQQTERLVADKALFDLIRDRRIHHNGDPVLREHVMNAGSKTPPDDNTRMRFVKKAANSKIDALVACSMAVSEVLRLNLA